MTKQEEVTPSGEQRKFTRGPWEISTTITATGHWPCVRGALDEDGGWVVALIDQQCVSGSDDEPEANARLIAASPTMYEYIQRRALTGDKDAQAIIETL